MTHGRPAGRALMGAKYIFATADMAIWNLALIGSHSLVKEGA